MTRLNRNRRRSGTVRPVNVRAVPHPMLRRRFLPHFYSLPSSASSSLRLPFPWHPYPFPSIPPFPAPGYSTARTDTGISIVDYWYRTGRPAVSPHVSRAANKQLAPPRRKARAATGCIDVRCELRNTGGRGGVDLEIRTSGLERCPYWFLPRCIYYEWRNP